MVPAVRVISDIMLVEENLISKIFKERTHMRVKINVDKII